MTVDRDSITEEDTLFLEQEEIKEQKLCNLGDEAELLLQTSAFLLDTIMWRCAVLRPFSRTLLAQTCDSQKHFVVSEYCLMNMNQKASGKITGSQMYPQMYHP